MFFDLRVMLPVSFSERHIEVFAPSNPLPAKRGGASDIAEPASSEREFAAADTISVFGESCLASETLQPIETNANNTEVKVIRGLPRVPERDFVQRKIRNQGTNDD